MARNLLALTGSEQLDRSVHIVLETERMLLRRLTEADARPLAALYGDPRVMRFITLQPPSRAAVESKILRAYLREYRELADGLGSFAAIEKETGQMAGSFSLKPANSYGLTGGTELGYRLYPAFWGRGLATEGARALITSAFERLHLDRVVATTMADNTGSWRVLEKCGMRRVGTFHYPDADLMPGGAHGDFVYEQSRDDWSRQDGSSSGLAASGLCATRQEIPGPGIRSTGPFDMTNLILVFLL